MGFVPLYLTKWIYDTDSINFTGVLKILGEEHATASLLCGAHHQGVPKRKPVKPMQIDCGQNVGDAVSSHIKFSQQFDSSAGNLSIYS